MSENAKKVSVIVPIYNAEQCLHRCVDSILAQTYTNLEIILVDDGSPDGCPAICDEYAAQDNRIVVIHKESGGVSSARNAGLDAAHGEFVIFADSDDYLFPSLLTNSLAVYTEDFDLVQHGYLKELADGKLIEYVSSDTIPESQLEQQALALAYPGICSVPGNSEIISPMIWDKVYRLDIIRKFGIRFDESIRKAEDTLFNIAYVSHCRKVIFLRDVSYQYCYIPDSIIHAYTAPREIGVDKSVYIISQMNRLLREADITSPQYDAFLSSRLVRIVIDSNENVIKNIRGYRAQRESIRNLNRWFPVYLKKYGLSLAHAAGKKFRFESWIVRHRFIAMQHLYAALMVRHHQ